MNTFAYMTLDGPLQPEIQFQVSVYLPVATVVFSWLLIKWQKWLVVLALLLALLSAFVVTADATNPMTRGAIIAAYGLGYYAAVWVSAVFPFLAIGVLYFAKVRSASVFQPR